MICLKGCKKKITSLQENSNNNKIEIMRLKMDITSYLRIIDEHSTTITNLTCRYKSESEKLHQEIENLKKPFKKNKSE